ncbi:MAG: hypothetical protein QNJ18_01110 [Xenococcaceae cyanobacterium MO_167.B52]|nr:hypothetical protein [Xenococcaceae cyanobacterium MO_167.B52]
MFSDPTLIKAARRIYLGYIQMNSKFIKQPYGVAVDRDSLRGHLIFREKPILLPGECFIRFSELETEQAC